MKNRTSVIVNYGVSIEENEALKNKIATLTERVMTRKDEKMFFNNSKEYYRRNKR